MTLENQNPQETRPEIKIVFDCLVEDEIRRAKYYCEKNDEFRANGYRLSLPKSIEEKIESGEKVTEEEIEKAVRDEFNESENEEQILWLKEEWDKIKERFFENLKTLGLPIQEKYFIILTKYGTGGSYNGEKKNVIQINCKNTKNPPVTLAHEIVHLTIEHLIQKYNIEHWTKERIVNLIMNKFFPENATLQKNPENAEKISEIFEANFPDIEKIIRSISKIDA